MLLCRRNDWVYFGVRTCEVFLCFVTILFVLSIVLILCSTSLVNVTGSYAKDEPNDSSCRNFKERIDLLNLGIAR